MTQRRKLTCLGTLKVDVITSLTDDVITNPGDVYERRPIRVDIGGTAASLVRAVRRTDAWSVHVVAAIGDDPLASSISSWLKTAHATAWLQHCRDSPNAIVLVSEIESTPRRRLLVSSVDSPHLKLTPEHIRNSALAFRGSHALVADCYSLQGTPSASALETALTLAKELGVFRVLDLVPHDLPRSVTLRELRPLLEVANAIVVEARTALALLEGHWSPEAVLSRDVAIAVSRQMGALVPEAQLLVRYGEHHIENCILVRQGEFTEYSSLYRHVPETRGFGDALLLTELTNVLSCKPRLVT